MIRHVFSPLLLSMLFIIACGDGGESLVAVSTYDGVQTDRESGEISFKIEIAVKDSAKNSYRIDEVSFDLVTNRLRSVHRAGTATTLDRYPHTETMEQIARDLFGVDDSVLVIAPGSKSDISEKVYLRFYNGESRKIPEDTMFVKIVVKAQPVDGNKNPAGDAVSIVEYISI